MKSFSVYDIYQEIMLCGHKSSPRGQAVIDLEYFQGEITSPFSNYKSRKYPMDYFKAEFQWYLNGDGYDARILKHAKMWTKLVQPDGCILSNYGQYWFGWQQGFQWVIDTLTADPDSRQAYIPMNNYTHAFKGNPDFVCTQGIQFRITDGHLNMHVKMRSSDAIYGLATDLPCFWLLWKMVGLTLGVPFGRFIFSADSIHIYEKHYEMVKQILADGPTALVPVEMPAIRSKDDVEDLLSGDLRSPLGVWLKEVEL